MKYNLTKEGVKKWNDNSNTKVYTDTLFDAEMMRNGVVLVSMCDVESPKMTLNKDCIVPARIESPKQKKPILIDDNGGIYLNKEAQEQLDRIEGMLVKILENI